MLDEASCTCIQESGGQGRVRGGGGSVGWLPPRPGGRRARRGRGGASVDCFPPPPESNLVEPKSTYPIIRPKSEN
jgi:hypothetical protein